MKSLEEGCKENGKLNNLNEWDYDINKLTTTTISYGSTKKVYWKSKEGHSWECRIYSRTAPRKSKCPVVSIKDVPISR